MVRKTTVEKDLKIDRRGKKTERRAKQERRIDITKALEFDGEERRQSHRRKLERRRQIDPTTCERDYCDEEIEFMRAMESRPDRPEGLLVRWKEHL